MKPAKLIIFLMFVLIYSYNLCAQNFLNGPESIAFDSLNNRYLVSSLNNAQIVEIDSNGNQSVFKSGLSPMVLGNCIYNNTLYVTTGTRVKGLDLTSADIILDMFIPEASQMDGVTTDNDGNLYVVDGVANKVFKINLSEESYDEFIVTGLPTQSQDIIYDKINNRLLLCAYQDSSPIKIIDPESGFMTSVVYTEAGGFDGITLDQYGNIYVGSWNTSTVYRYEPTFIDPPVIIATGIDEPTGLDFNMKDNILAVPQFAPDSVIFIPVEFPQIFSNFMPEVLTGNAPATILFEDISFAENSITQWQWDFNGDGATDSYEQNPTWTFNDPGEFTVSLEIQTSDGSETITRENLIKIFAGETAARYRHNDNYVECPSSENINLTDAFTFEAVIKPESWGPTNTFGEARIFHKGAVDLYLNMDVIAAWNAHSMIVNIRTADGTLSKLTTPDSSIVLDEWQHVAVTYDSAASELKIFINGENQELTTLYTGTPSGNLFSNLESPIIVGNNGNLNRGFDGLIDEVRVWNIARTEAEIIENVDNPLTGSESGLIAYWPMNEGSRHVLYDHSVNQNHAFVVNTLWDEGVDLSQLLGIEDDPFSDNNLTGSFSLSQNYPNPFNPTTMISYRLKIHCNVELSIYNSLGQKMATLVNSAQSAGEHQVEWDAVGFSSGIYFYELKAGTFSSVKKMVLIK